MLYGATETSWYIDGDMIDEYLRLDLRLAKDLRFGASKGRIELIGHGVADSYNEFSRSNSFDPRFYARLSIDLP